MANLSGKTGFSPVQTRISLANNTTTTVQNFSAYDGIRLSGFVYVDATVDKRATVEVWVVKNGAGTYEVAAADVAGDDLSGSPIVTFSMSGTSLIATLPNFTGFVSAYIQYHLSAPQLGATFPLTVDGSNVTLATSTVQGAYKAGQAPGYIGGSAIGAGYIGQKIDLSTSSVTTVSANTWKVSASTVAQLTAGEWLIFARYVVNLNAMSTADMWGAQLSTANTPGTNTIPGTYAEVPHVYKSTSGNSSYHQVVGFVNASGTTDIWFQAYTEDITGSVGLASNSFAVRIA